MQKYTNIYFSFIRSTNQHSTIKIGLNQAVDRSLTSKRFFKILRQKKFMLLWFAYIKAWQQFLYAKNVWQRLAPIFWMNKKDGTSE